MNDRPHRDPTEAKRLSHTRRLADLTALLQRVLPGATPAIRTGGDGGANDAIGPAPTPASAERPSPSHTAPMLGSGAANTPEERPERTLLARLPDVLRSVVDRVKTIGAESRSPGRPQPPPASPEIVPPGGGRFIAGSYSNHAGTRAYKLYVPSGYDGRRPLPLLVMLHGCTQSADDFAAGTRMNVVAEEHTWLVVYPEQDASANASRCWNWFNAREQRRDQGEPSLIAGITRRVMRDYAVDARRVYAAGLSAGAAAAAVLGETYPDLYAAIGVHSGLPSGAAHNVPSAFTAMRNGAVVRPRGSGGTDTEGGERVVPTIVFHGDHDTTVHPANGDQVIERAMSPGLRISAEDGHVPGGHAYRCTRYADASGLTILEHWVVHGAGHAWSGGSPSGSYTDPHGPDAARAMIRFFLTHAKAEGASSSARPVA